MKDAELREMIGNLERKIDSLDAMIIATDWSKTFDKYLEDIKKRVERIQEVVEQGRRFEEIRIVPSTRLPAVIGMAAGAIIFLAGMFFAWVLK